MQHKIMVVHHDFHLIIQDVYLAPDRRFAMDELDFQLPAEIPTPKITQNSFWCKNKAFPLQIYG